MQLKWKATAVSSVAIALALILTFSYVFKDNPLMPFSTLTLVFASGSNPDSYGNKIYLVDVIQGGEIKGRIHDWNYTSGVTLEIESNQKVTLKICVAINQTLCSQDLAKNYTRVYLNITDVCTNELGTYYATVTPPDAPTGCYGVIYYSDEWVTATDKVYNVTLDYDAYY